MSKLWAVLFTLLILSCGPCNALIYDAGDPQRGGTAIGSSFSCVWAAEPFKFTSDAYVTQYGAAIACAVGSSPGMGFNLYLTNTLVDATDDALAVGLIAPENMNLTYYYVQLEAPVRLNANQIYYLVFVPNTNNFSGAISVSPLAGYNGLGSTDYGNTWGVISRPLSIRLDGYFVPEPSSLVTLLTGAVLLGLRLKRKK